MFVVLRIIPQKNGRLLPRQSIDVKKTEVAGTHFFTVTVKHRGKKPKINKIAEVLYRINLPVLASKSDVISEFEGIEGCCDRNLRVHLLANAVSQIGVGSVLISDRFGEFPFCLEKLISGVRQVHIATENPSVYTVENIKVFSLLGASATISQTVLNAKYDILFSPFCDSSRFFADASFLAGEGGFDIDDNSVGLGREYIDVKPEGVDCLSFAAALYEKCGKNELSKCVPRILRNKKTNAVIKISPRREHVQKVFLT